jgi:geranylgeranyl diphosphate synthase, type I
LAKSGVPPELEAAMKRVLPLVELAVNTSFKVEGRKTLVEGMRYLPSLGGKRMRPFVAFLAGEAVGPAHAGSQTLMFGCGLELIHNFTLVHDDIMDKATLRRKHETVHKRWGENTAINAGDALFALGFESVLRTSGPAELKVELAVEVARMVRGIADGQQMDLEFEDQRVVREADYLKMIELKTSLMFSVGAYGGARIGGEPKPGAERMRAYGRNLGIGFQIRDDVIDLTQNRSEIGKEQGGDLKNGKKTVIALRTIDRMSSAQARTFKAAWRNKKATRRQILSAVKVMREVGAIGEASALALDYASRAKDELEHLNPSQARRNLLLLADYAASREK